MILTVINTALGPQCRIPVIGRQSVVRGYTHISSANILYQVLYLNRLIFRQANGVHIPSVLLKNHIGFQAYLVNVCEVKVLGRW